MLRQSESNLKVGSFMKGYTTVFAGYQANYLYRLDIDTLYT